LSAATIVMENRHKVIEILVTITKKKPKICSAIIEKTIQHHMVVKEKDGCIIYSLKNKILIIWQYSTLNHFLK